MRNGILVLLCVLQLSVSSYKFDLVDELNSIESVRFENDNSDYLDTEQSNYAAIEAKLTRQRNTAIIAVAFLLLTTVFLLFRSRQSRKLITQQREALFLEQAQKQQLEREKVEFELEQHKRKLAGMALQIAEKNELLKDIESQLVKVEETNKSVTGGIRNAVRSSEIQEKEWTQFLQLFESIHPQFITQVQERCPDLTKNDIRLCSLERMNFSTKQIASILHISGEGVKKARYRLKKKLKVSGDTPVSIYLRGI